MQWKEAVVAYFEVLSRHLKDKQQLLQHVRSPERDLNLAPPENRWETWLRFRKHTTSPLCIQLRTFCKEHITSMQHSLRALVFLCILRVLVQALPSCHTKVRTPRGVVCRSLLGGSAHAHLYPYSMDSASLTQCGRDVTSRRVFPSSPLRWTHLIPTEGRLGHVVCVWVGLGHCFLTAAMSSLDDKQRLSRISVSGPQDEVWNGQARCCLQSRYFVSLYRRSNGCLSCHPVVATFHGDSEWGFLFVKACAKHSS
jgi:hypothetical protein